MPDAAITISLCVAAVAVTEVASDTLDLWRFPSRAQRAFAAVIAGVGFAYETANLFSLRLWKFPNDRLLFLRGRAAIIVGAGVPWGILPALIPLA